MQLSFQDVNIYHRGLEGVGEHRMRKQVPVSWELGWRNPYPLGAWLVPLTHTPIFEIAVSPLPEALAAVSD
jgi:hypothetical protein